MLAPKLKRKALKSRYLASMFPMIMLGGSPIIVPVPPIYVCMYVYICIIHIYIYIFI